MVCCFPDKLRPRTADTVQPSRNQITKKRFSQRRKDRRKGPQRNLARKQDSSGDKAAGKQENQQAQVQQERLNLEREQSPLTAHPGLDPTAAPHEVLIRWWNIHSQPTKREQPPPPRNPTH